MPKALRIPRALPLTLLLLIALGSTDAPRAADAAPGAHPTMGNTSLSWHTRLSDAQLEARSTGKLLFVEVSRPTACLRCKILFNSILSPRQLGRRVDNVAVGIHFDWTKVDYSVFNRLKHNLGNRLLVDPTVAFLTPDLGFVSGYSPRLNAHESEMHRSLERALRTAERRCASMRRTAPRVGSATSTNRDDETGTSSVREAPPREPVEPARPSTHDRFVWYRDIDKAQRAARAQGKFLLLMSTKPGCGLCQKLKDRVVPQIQGDISRYAVAYVYDITRPESGQVDRCVRGMNRGARLMPLAGFATPDLQPLKGFSGSTSASQLRAYLRQADRAYRGR